MVKVLLPVTTVFLALFCQGCVSKYFYYPDSHLYETPAHYGLRYEEVFFPSGDGTKLSGWFIPAIGPPQGTVAHLHGNAQNMSAHFGFVSWLPAQGFNVLVFDYRGYGKSAGDPDRKGVFEDSVAALQYVASRKDVDRKRLLVLGQSLGGTNAIAVIGGGKFREVRGVAIESAFASYREIVRDKMALIPILSLFKWPLSYLVIGDRYNAIDVVDRISPIPLLLIYQTEDPVVPFTHGEELYKAARQPKTFWSVSGARHAGTFVNAASPYRKKLVQFFMDALTKPGAGAPQ